jgi:YHS domain-containing protein
MEHGVDNVRTGARDPVCGRSLAQVDSQLQTEYADVVYHFCSQECLERFVEQPDIFTAQPGRGRVASRDRALRGEEHEGELEPGAAARVPTTPPVADPGG